MSWRFQTLCPHCGLENNRYHSVLGMTSLACLGVTCHHCFCEYIAVADIIKCLGCDKCIWDERGYQIKVIDYQ